MNSDSNKTNGTNNKNNSNHTNGLNHFESEAKKSTISTENLIDNNISKSNTNTNTKSNITETTDNNKENINYDIEVPEVSIDMHDNDKQRVYFIGRNKRIWVFILIITINVMANSDHGTLPAATIEIQKDVNISHANLGLLGTLVFTGNLIGNFLYYCRFFNSNSFNQ